MSLKLNGATNGSIELDVPDAIGSDLNVTLPATAGEVAVKGADGSVDLGDVNIDSSGRVGIGTTSQNDVLSIKSTGSASTGRGITINASASGDTAGVMRILSDSGTQHAEFAAYANNVIISADEASSVIQLKTAGSARMAITNQGHVTINKTAIDANTAGHELRSGTAAQHLIGKSLSGTVNGIYFHHNAAYVGGLNYSNTGTSLATSSDYRIKENIVKLPDAISRVKQLNPIQFNFISEPDQTVEGFIAHELGEVVAEACFGEKDAVNEDGSIKPQSIAQEKLIPLLTAALQEAISKIETLEAKVAALEANP